MLVTRQGRPKLQHRASHSLIYMHVASDWRKDRDTIDVLLMKSEPSPSK
jgi:hypothetical protein